MDDSPTTPISPTTPTPDADRSRNRVRDLWQLDIPLVLGLALCAFLTIVEARRAGEGFWRAWVYTFEWPVIAAFIIWIWWRYKHEGNLTKGMVRRWRERTERYEREAREAEETADPGLAAWRQHMAELRGETGETRERED